MLEVEITVVNGKRFKLQPQVRSRARRCGRVPRFADELAHRDKRRYVPEHTN